MERPGGTDERMVGDESCARGFDAGGGGDRALAGMEDSHRVLCLVGVWVGAAALALAVWHLTRKADRRRV